MKTSLRNNALDEAFLIIAYTEMCVKSGIKRLFQYWLLWWKRTQKTSNRREDVLLPNQWSVTTAWPSPDHRLTRLPSPTCGSGPTLGKSIPFAWDCIRTSNLELTVNDSHLSSLSLIRLFGVGFIRSLDWSKVCFHCETCDKYQNVIVLTLVFKYKSQSSVLTYNI